MNKVKKSPYGFYMPVIEDIIGRSFNSVSVKSDTIVFKNSTETFTLYHEQECCEDVYIESIVGDLTDLMDSEILVAEERKSSETPVSDSDYEDSFTWTFYSFRTIKGSVDIRFYGTSNGYYSESVSISYNKETLF